MKKMLMLAIAAGILILPGQAFSEWQVGKPIVTYWWPPLPLTDAVAQQAVNGGFNLVGVSSVAELNVAQQYGLRGMWHVPGYHGLPPDATINQIRSHPALYAYWIDDEPGIEEFRSHGTTVQHLRALDPDHMAYINLLPIQGAATPTAYSNYLNQYINTVQPELLSYDHYQLFNWGDGKDYFDNLNRVSAASRQAGLPFMQIVQGSAWEPGDPKAPGAPGWRIPNANELRFLNYTTLAYGAQGISYFAYYTQHPNTGGLNPNPDGTPTSVYTALQSINPEFVAIAEQVQSMNSIGAYHLGDQPPGTTRLPGHSPFSLSPAVPDTTYEVVPHTAPVKGMLFGFFGSTAQLAGATYALVVNLDYTSSVTTTVNGPGDLAVFDPATGTWSPTGSNQVTLDLLRGGGALVRGRAPGAKSYFNNVRGDGRWDNAGNWSDGIVPMAGDIPSVGDGKTVLIDSTTAAVYHNFKPGNRDNGSSAGTVNMTGGTATGVGTLVADGATGTWNQSGGVTMSAIFDVGRWNSPNNAIGYANFSGDAHLIQNGDTRLGRFLNIALEHGTAWGKGYMTISDNALVEAGALRIGDGTLAGSQADGHLDISDNGMMRIALVVDDAGRTYGGDLTANELLLGWLSGGRITAEGGTDTVAVTYNAVLNRTELTAIPEPVTLSLLSLGLSAVFVLRKRSTSARQKDRNRIGGPKRK